jgi:hypothetical protein
MAAVQSIHGSLEERTEQTMNRLQCWVLAFVWGSLLAACGGAGLLYCYAWCLVDPGQPHYTARKLARFFGDPETWVLLACTTAGSVLLLSGGVLLARWWANDARG